MKKLWENWRKYLGEQQERSPIYVPSGHPWSQKPHLMPGVEIKTLGAEEDEWVDDDEGEDEVDTTEPPELPKEPVPDSGEPIPTTGEGEFIKGWEAPEGWKSFDDFYSRIKERGIELPEFGPDYKYGGEHQTAWERLQLPEDFDEKVSELMSKHDWDQRVASEYEAARVKGRWKPLTQSPEKFGALMKLSRLGGINFVGNDGQGRPDFRNFEFTPEFEPENEAEQEETSRLLDILLADNWNPETQEWEPFVEEKLHSSEELGITPEEGKEYERLRDVLLVKGTLSTEEMEKFDKYREKMEAEQQIGTYGPDELKESIYRAVLKILQENQIK